MALNKKINFKNKQHPVMKLLFEILLWKVYRTVYLKQ